MKSFIVRPLWVEAVGCTEDAPAVHLLFLRLFSSTAGGKCIYHTSMRVMIAYINSRFTFNTSFSLADASLVHHIYLFTW